MNSKNFLLNNIIIILLFSSTFIYGQNLNDAVRLTEPGLGIGARALGLGNAYIALSDDASGMYFNPAGLGLIKRMETMVGLNYSRFTNDVSFFDNNTNYSNSNTKLDQVGFVFPFPTMQGSFVIGLSYNAVKDFTSALKFDGFNNSNNSMIQHLLNTDLPFDLYLTDDSGLVTPINGRLNQSGTTLTSGNINNWNLSASMEVYKNLFIGGTLSILGGSLQVNRDYYEDDTQNIYQGETAAGHPQTTDFRTFYYNTLLNWDISGWNAKVGMLYQFDKYARFGATIQFPQVFNIKETFDVDGRSEFGTGQSYSLNKSDYSDEVEYEVFTPFVLSGGFSVNYEGLIVAAEASFIDYSQTEFDNPTGLTPQFISGLNKDIRDNLRPVINFNTGAEYTIPNTGIRLRGGFILMQSPYNDDPSEFNKKYITGGFGFLIDRTIAIDFGYAYGWWKDFGDNYGFNLSRTFQDITTHKVMINFSHRF